MQQDTAPTSASRLAKRLSEQREREAATIEKATLSELEKLGKSLAGKSSVSLSTTRTDIESSIKDLRTFTLKTWAQVGIAVGSMVLIVGIGGMGWIHYQMSKLSSIEEKEAQSKANVAVIDQAIARRQAKLAALPGITLTQDDQGRRYLMLRGWMAGRPVPTGPTSSYIPIAPIPQTSLAPAPSIPIAPTYK